MAKSPNAADVRLTDGRQSGEFVSRYPAKAWVQIVIELVWLVALLIFSLFQLFRCSVEASTTSQVSLGPIGTIGVKDNKDVLLWCAMFAAGVCGGASFALKWLYHSVAKNSWNRDRIVWRLVVPLLSGVLSVFLGFMVVSGLVPLLSRTAFDTFFVALGFGYFVGYFSDNVLASLHGLADRMFGTLESRRSRNGGERQHAQETANRSAPQSS